MANFTVGQLEVASCATLSEHDLKRPLQLALHVHSAYLLNVPNLMHFLVSLCCSTPVTTPKQSFKLARKRGHILQSWPLMNCL